MEHFKARKCTRDLESRSILVPNQGVYRAAKATSQIRVCLRRIPEDRANSGSSSQFRRCMQPQQNVIQNAIWKSLNNMASV